MSQRYMVMAVVNGEIRILSMISNADEGLLQMQAEEMTLEMFPESELGEISIFDWPEGISA